MRLIDADSLKASIKRQVKICHSISIISGAKEIAQIADEMEKGMMQEIDNAPTIKPSTNNTGKWLGKYCPYTCDQCGKTSDSRTPFCRYCGADMRE